MAGAGKILKRPFIRRYLLLLFPDRLIRILFGPVPSWSNVVTASTNSLSLPGSSCTWTTATQRVALGGLPRYDTDPSNERPTIPAKDMHQKLLDNAPDASQAAYRDGLAGAGPDRRFMWPIEMDKLYLVFTKTAAVPYKLIHRKHNVLFSTKRVTVWESCIRQLH